MTWKYYFDPLRLGRERASVGRGAVIVMTKSRIRKHLSLFSQLVYPLDCVSLLTTMATTLTRRRGSIDIVDAKVAVDLATAQSYRENVFLFVPNLIGKLTIL